MNQDMFVALIASAVQNIHNMMIEMLALSGGKTGHGKWGAIWEIVFQEQRQKKVNRVLYPHNKVLYSNT